MTGTPKELADKELADTEKELCPNPGGGACLLPGSKFVRLQNTVTLHVLNAAKLCGDATPQPGDCQNGTIKVALFVDGRNSQATALLNHDARQSVRFSTRYGQSANAADALFWRGAASGFHFDGKAPVSLAIGLASASLPGSTPVRSSIEVFHPILTGLGLLGLVMTALGLVLAFKDTKLLRDEAGDADNPPYSLAKSQMFFWFFIVFGSFVFIFLVQGTFNDVLTGGVLTLLGIEGAKGLAAVMIPRAQSDAPPATSINFVHDITHAGGSPQLHRIQMIAWTLVMGGIFLHSIVTSFQMPDFDEKLLLLSGLVGGLYLGFKWPEPPKTPDTAHASAAVKPKAKTRKR